MSSSLGSLVISLEANMANFAAGLDKACYQADQFQKKIESVASYAKKALEAIVVIDVVIEIAHQLEDIVSSSIDAAESLDK